MNQFASALKRAGVERGDRVTIYMPMVPETAVAMLACTRIGAPHSVIFGGTPLPGLTTLKPGSATKPFPGIEAQVVNDKGEPAKAGYLVIKKPWPGMLRGIYRDPQRFQAQYWSRYPGLYFTGDGAKMDEDGYFWLLGRVDDVMNISGHRVSTMEVESALVDRPLVAEAAVIGRPHEIKGQAIAAFVTIKDGTTGSKDLMEELNGHVSKKIGALARPR